MWHHVWGGNFYSASRLGRKSFLGITPGAEILWGITPDAEIFIGHHAWGRRNILGTSRLGWKSMGHHVWGGNLQGASRLGRIIMRREAWAEILKGHHAWGESLWGVTPHRVRQHLKKNVKSFLLE